MSDALPEYLADQTQDVILQRMLGNVPAGVDTTEGSFVWDVVTPASIELATAAIWAQQVLKYGFAETTYGAYLDLRCGEVGLTPRKAAVCATETLTITGTAGTPIATETVVCTPADNATSTASVEFTTDATVTIPAGGSITVPITAVVAGAAGNVALGTITVLSVPIPGVASISNTAMNGDGTDEESDTALLARYLAKVQNPGTSGNRADYKQWAMAIPGVGDAQVIPLWNGNGTVKVVLLGADNLPASVVIVAAAQEAICPGGLPTGDGEAPIGAAVTVTAATAVPINVTASLTMDGTVAEADIKTAFVAALTSYLAGQAFVTDPTNNPPTQNVSIKWAQIGSQLLNQAGVTDYANLLANGGTANIAIALGQAAVPGTVTFS